MFLNHARNIDTVDDTMEEIREQMELANEINEAISTPLGEVVDEVRIYSFFLS
jgi:hypothetical protein